MMEALVALAEPSRYRIVELLREGPRPVNEIAQTLSLAQPQVSKHLSVLKGAGWVRGVPRAQLRLYELRPDPLRALHAWLERYREIWDQRMDALDELVVEEHRKELKRGKRNAEK